MQKELSEEFLFFAHFFHDSHERSEPVSSLCTYNSQCREYSTCLLRLQTYWQIFPHMKEAWVWSYNIMLDVLYSSFNVYVTRSDLCHFRGRNWNLGPWSRNLALEKKTSNSQTSGNARRQKWFELLIHSFSSLLVSIKIYTLGYVCMKALLVTATPPVKPWPWD